MHLFTFDSLSDPKLLGFAADPEGVSLPTVEGPWVARGDQLMKPTIPSSEPILSEVRQRGYFISRLGVPAEAASVPAAAQEMQQPAELLTPA